ncbi:MAG: AAA family ATPase, partial [Chloroflexi bacterium]|nr:AAA family ATPase [Chloroflexota bacterium]
DLCGPNARARRIDERLARENPGLVGVRPATRLATAIFVYSFGGLHRGPADAEALPPGVTEAELLASVISPELDNITATAALSELRNHCLYLHYDGVRYVFKKDPNITKLIEDEEQQIARKPVEVRQRIKELLTQRLQGHREAVVWPERSVDLPDEDPSFLVGYLPMEFASENRQTQEKRAKELLEKYGERPRRYRNGVGLAVPHKDHTEPLRRAVRYLMAIERIEAKKAQLRLNRDQVQQLNERKRTEEAAAESSFRQLYSAVWLPRAENGSIGLEPVEAGGRPLQSTGVHERVMELLTNTTKKVFSSTTPRKIVELMRLGEAEPGQAPRLGNKTSEIRDAFYSFMGFTRLDTSDALRKAIARGVQESVFGYTSGTVPALGDDRKYQVAQDKTMLGRTVPDDEVDLDSGFIIMPSAIPPAPEPVVASTGVQVNDGKGEAYGTQDGSKPVEEPAGASKPAVQATRKDVTITIKGSRDQLFKAWPAVANLADKAGKASIQVSATSEDGFDPSWLRNAVYEPLEEAEVLEERKSPAD